MRALLWPLPLVLAGGCSLLFEPSGGPGDGGGPIDARAQDAPVQDAAIDAQAAETCPDGVPGLFDSINSSMDEDDPAVTADGLTLFFARAPLPGDPANLYMARRSSRCEPWDSQQLVVEDAADLLDRNNPTLGPDGLLYYTETGDSGSTIYTLRWDEPEAIPEENDQPYVLLAPGCKQDFTIEDVFVVADGVFYISIISCETDGQRQLVQIVEETGPETAWFDFNQPWVSSNEDFAYASSTNEGGIYAGTDCASECVFNSQVAEIPQDKATDPWLTSGGWLYYAAPEAVEVEPRDLFAIKVEEQ